MTDTHFAYADYDSEIGFTRKAAMCVFPIRLAPAQVTTLTGKISVPKVLSVSHSITSAEMDVLSTGTSGR